MPVLVAPPGGHGRKALHHGHHLSLQKWVLLAVFCGACVGLVATTVIFSSYRRQDAAASPAAAAWPEAGGASPRRHREEAAAAAGAGGGSSALRSPAGAGAARRRPRLQAAAQWQRHFDPHPPGHDWELVPAPKWALLSRSLRWDHPPPGSVSHLSVINPCVTVYRGWPLVALRGHRVFPHPRPQEGVPNMWLSRMWVSPLTRDWQLPDNAAVVLDARPRVRTCSRGYSDGPEDPRLVTHMGRLYLLYNAPQTLQSTARGGPVRSSRCSGGFVRMYLMALTVELPQPAAGGSGNADGRDAAALPRITATQQPLMLTLSGQELGEVEKNWVAYSLRGALYMVVSVEPPEACRVDMASGVCAMMPPPPDWHWVPVAPLLREPGASPLHGGSPALLVDDSPTGLPPYFLSVVHAARHVEVPGRHARRLYVHCALATATEPPFPAIGRSRELQLVAGTGVRDAQGHPHVRGVPESVAFAAGLARVDATTVVVSYGSADTFARMVTYDLREWEADFLPGFQDNGLPGV